jgi:hypothetical protein
LILKPDTRRETDSRIISSQRRRLDPDPIRLDRLKV